MNHWLEMVLAFSGLSLVLGYGILVLALPLLLLPTAFPELSRPRDALWSLVMAVLAPLLLLNRLPVFSSAGFGELVATVLMARLAFEVGQGRWGALTPDQQMALRHLPRWRSAGSDLVAAVVQAANAAWSKTTQTAKAAWQVAYSSRKPVEQRQQEQPAQKPAQKPVRKQWIRPDPSDGAQGDQASEPSPATLDGVPELGISSGLASDNAPDAQLPQQIDGDPGDVKGAAAAPEAAETRTEPPEPVVQPPEGSVINAVDHGPQPGERTPEAPSAPEPAEEAQQAQPVGGTDTPEASSKEAAAAPEAAETRTEPPEPVVQPPEESVINAVDHGPQPGERTPEVPSAPEPAEEAQQAQPVGGTDTPEASSKEAAAAPEAAETRTEPPEPVVQPPEESVINAVDHGPQPGERTPEVPSAPEPAEEAQQAQPVGGTDTPEASSKEAAAVFQDGENNTPMDLPPDDESGDMAIASEDGEVFAADNKADAAGATQEVDETDASGIELEPAQPVEDGSVNLSQERKDVVSNFDEIDVKLWSSS